jgi:hypothetical protein
MSRDAGIKKPPSRRFLDIRFKLFQSARLPLLHRRWAGIAKVKIKEEARKHHDRAAKKRGVKAIVQ